MNKGDWSVEKSGVALLCAVFLSFFPLGCANPGSGPDGGPYDEEPPRLVAMTPKIGEKDVNHLKKVTLVFSENVKLDNPSEKVVVSPPQEEMPEIKVSGKRVSVELLDTLKPNTTYTIDFSDAIQDATEGNPLGQFTYFFSTGGEVDTMEVAGNVVDAETLEPIKGILVGLYDVALPDSAFATQPLSRVARTDEQGRFAIKGVRQGQYRIYALKDLDGNAFWNRGEQLAFLSDTLTTGCYADIRHDTIWADTVRWDSIRAIPYTHFTPDDIVLRAFNEKSTLRTRLKTVREVPNHFTSYFTAPSSHVPTLQMPGRSCEGVFLEDRNATNDTITYWILDSIVAANDSLQVYYTYEATNDSTFQRYLVTDTLDLVPRMTNARILKEKKQEEERWQKQVEKRHKRGDYSQDQRPVEALRMKESIPATLPPDENLAFTTDEPIMRLDTAGIHLSLVVDSVETPVPLRVERQGLMLFRVLGEWRPEQKYVIALDSAIVEGISGHVNNPTRREFRITSQDDVGSLFVTLTGTDTTAVIVQLLKTGDKVAKQTAVIDGHADFFYLKPGDYFLRAFADENGNGRWDTGDYLLRRQPETVTYYPEKVVIRENWDTEVTWNLKALPALRQKPADLRKAKGQQRKQSAHEKNIERERKLK